MKKFIAILLISIFIVTMVTSCGNDGKKPSDNTTLSDVKDTVADTVDPRPKLPEKDFGGYEFRSISRGRLGSLHWFTFDTVAYDDLAGDVVNDAVLARNQYIEDTYNIVIKIVETEAHQSVARTSILAGSDDFDIYGEAIASAAALASEGLLLDLYDIPFINLDAKWWDKNANEQLSLLGKLYVTVSDFTLRDKHGTWVTLFTKSMIDKYSFENPYELVKSGKWTLDKMYDMAKIVSFDVDGDGKMTEVDSWGTIGETWNANALMIGTNSRSFTKDKNDSPEFSMVGERTINAYEKVHKILGDKNVTLFTTDMKQTFVDPYVDGYAPIMADDRALFNITGMNRVILLRGMEADFGIIPIPKFDENQEKYCSVMTYGNINALSIPVTNKDLDRTGIILEAITYESSITSYPAYIETSIKTKYSRDEESIEMLDTIFANRVFDIGFIFNWGSVYSFYPGLITSKSPDIASSVAKTEVTAIAGMEKTLLLFESLQ